MCIEDQPIHLSRSIFPSLKDSSFTGSNLGRFAYFDTYAFMVFEDKFDP